MDWIELVKQALMYIEQHIMEPISADEVGQCLHVSGFYLQKGFKILTGYSIGEYIRNRRLYLAALDVLKGEDKVIELSDKYGYETPESFSKAFRRFHGASPMQIKANSYMVKPFLPLELNFSVQGGSRLSVAIEKMEEREIIGIPYTVCYDTAFDLIPGYWDEYCANAMQEVCKKLQGCNIGKYGVCLELGKGKKEFLYLIAGDYHGEDVPEGLVVKKLPAHTWAKFHCTGPMPSAVQSLNRRIFEEWLPQHNEYVIADGINVEVYEAGDITADDYKSEIWIPIIEK